MPYGGAKPDRTMSPANLPEEERRKLIAQQRNALYGDGPLPEGAGFADETGGARTGLSGPPVAALRGHSPLAYEYGRSPPVHQDAGSQAVGEGAQGSQSAGAQEQARANSNTSPQSNPGSKGIYDAPAAQPATRTSASSPGGSPPRQGPQGPVAPIGTRPSVSGPSANSALNKTSPLGQGYPVPGNGDGAASSSAAPSNPPSASTEGPNVGLSGWGARPNGWGKPGLGQASVWG